MIERFITLFLFIGYFEVERC